MEILAYLISVAQILLTGFGTWFLVREVNFSHRFEALTREMAEVAEMQKLYKSDLREFWILSVMGEGKHDRKTAQEMAASLSDKDLREGAEPDRQLWEGRVTESLGQFHKQTAPAQLRRRRRLLWTGFALLIGAGLIQLVAATAKLNGWM